MAKVSAPFTAEQVASLNAYQAEGVGHPLTCGGRECREVLRATPTGWVCPRCDYRQGWAHSFMADGLWHGREGAEPGDAPDPAS